MTFQSKEIEKGTEVKEIVGNWAVAVDLSSLECLGSALTLIVVVYLINPISKCKNSE